MLCEFRERPWHDVCVFLLPSVLYGTTIPTWRQTWCSRHALAKEMKTYMLVLLHAAATK
jgi:hypothetical protein